MDKVWQDLRYAFRGLYRGPGFAIIVIVTLGLGMGANTAVFSVMQGVLLRPLPFDAPQRLFAIWTIPQNQSARVGTSGPEYQDYREQSRSFEFIAEMIPRFTVTWTGGREPRLVWATGITNEFFPTLGVKPLLGRLYTPEEYRAEGGQVVISQNFWKQQLDEDPHVIGRVLEIDGQSEVVIGVMPSSPDLFPDTEVWLKLIPTFSWLQVRGNKFLSVFGRVKPGVTQEQAQQELTMILHRGAGEPQNTSVQLFSLKDELVGKVRMQVEAVMAAAALVLLVACVNVAYLLLARNWKRQSEIAVRLSIGASQGRILQQFVTENLVLAGLGGLLGLTLAWQGTRLATHNLDILPRAGAIGIDAYVFTFALAITIFTSLFIGWLPSVAFLKLPLYATLKTGRSRVSAPGRLGLRALLVSEVSLTVVLLVAAGLLLRSFWRVVHIDLGFQPDHVLTSYLRTNNYDDGRKFFPELLRRSADLAGVRSSALSDCMPGTQARSADLKFGDRANDPYNLPKVQACWVSADFFSATGTPILQGRSFTVRDDDQRPLTVIVNQALAKVYWPGESAIGKHIAANYVGPGRDNSDSPRFREVVGVVANIRQKGLEGSIEPAVYMPYLQDRTNHAFAALYWFVRSTNEPGALSGNLRSIVYDLRHNQPIERMQTMDEVLFATLAPRRLVLSLFGSFASLALLLSAVGIFGMIAYSASLRTPELGVRMALGAQRGEVRRLILQEGMLLTGIGIVLGTMAAAVVTRAMSALLFNVRPSDPLSFVTGAALIFVVAAAACAIPAWRASGIDPMSALRTE